MNKKIIDTFESLLTTDVNKITKKINDPKIKAKQVKQVLMEESIVFQKNQPIKRIKNMRSYEVRNFGELIQIDLMFIDSPRNTAQKIVIEKYKYLLIAVDTYSRYLSVYPLKSKKSEEVTEGLVSIVKTLRNIYFNDLDYFPIKLLSDDGKEFSEKQLIEKIPNIQLLRSKSKFGASIAERYIRILRDKIRLETDGKNVISVDKLDEIVKNINDMEKSTISNDGLSSNDIVFGFDKKPNKYIKVQPEEILEYKYKPGSYVRIINYVEKDGKIFVKKSAYNNYTAKIFSIYEASLDSVQNIPLYRLVSIDGNFILDYTFYEEELLQIPVQFVKNMTNEERDEHEKFTQEEAKTFKIHYVKLK